MVNEEIVGGLMSALSRGESLEKGMMTFYNAGYDKDEIEASAKVVYSQLGAQTMGVNGSLQDTLNKIALKAGVVAKSKTAEEMPKKMEASQEEMRVALQKKSPELNFAEDSKEQAPQNVSAYGEDKISSGSGTDELMDKIQKAIKELRPVSIPSKIEIINKNVESKSDKNEKRVSDYKEDTSKPVSKMLTYILVFILFLLLGLLGAVFFFKDELIKIFNNVGLA